MKTATFLGIATAIVLVIFTLVEYVTLFYWFQFGNSGPQGDFFLGLFVEHFLSLIGGLLVGMFIAALHEIGNGNPNPSNPLKSTSLLTLLTQRAPSSVVSLLRLETRRIRDAWRRFVRWSGTWRQRQLETWAP